MKFHLREIATIQTGLFANPVVKGDVVYLQAKHFDEYGQISAVLFPDLKADKISDKHLLKPGDVLFAAKGTKNFAAVFENQNPPSVASTSFFVIRLTDNRILPHYLMWFLNHPVTQKILKRLAIGTSLASISKAVLEELEISYPEAEKQIAIYKISQLRNRERNLKNQIESLREQQIQQQIINAIK